MRYIALTMGKTSEGESLPGELEEVLERGRQQADPVEVAAVDQCLASLLDQVETRPSTAAPSGVPAGLGEGRVASPAARPAAAFMTGVAMRTATPLRVVGREVALRCRGQKNELFAELADGVEPALIREAVSAGEFVLLELVAGEAAQVVGVLRTRQPDQIVLQARKIKIEAEEEIILRSGGAALRLRSDGDIEIVGSRIAAMSRGLFRLVGRMLRLN